MAANEPQPIWKLSFHSKVKHYLIISKKDGCQPREKGTVQPWRLERDQRINITVNKKRIGISISRMGTHSIHTLLPV